MPKPSAERVDVGRYARQAVANGWIVVLIVAALGGAAYLRAKSQSPAYASSAVVRVFDPNVTAVGGATPSANGDPAREVENQVLYAQSPRVWTEVIRRLGSDTARSIQSHAALGSTNTDTIRFTTESSSRGSAQLAAQTYADVYLDQRRSAIARRFGSQAAELREQAVDVQARIDVVDAEIAALDPSTPLDVQQNLDIQRQGLAARYANLISIAGQADLAKLARQQTMDVVQAAEEPGTPVKPAPVRDATVGCALGLLIGLAAVALRLRNRETLMTSEDLAAELQGLPFVTSIPFRHHRLRRRKGAYALDIVDSPNDVREAYRALRANLMLGDLDHPIRSLLVTSARGGEGKTTIAANVALSLAQAGERVVVVDCDLRTPALHERFGIANNVGLSTLLTSSSTACDALQQVEVDGTKITVLPAGPPPPDPADLFLGVHAAQAISALTERFRYVVLDCPPILSFADAMTLPWLVDGVLFVARAGRTKAVDVRHAELRLRQVSAPLLGAVLVGPHADRAAIPNDLDPPESRSYSAPNGAATNGAATNGAVTNGTATNGASPKHHPTMRTADLVLDE